MSQAMNDLLYNNQREDFLKLWETCGPEDRAWIEAQVMAEKRAATRYWLSSCRILDHINSVSNRKFRQVPSNTHGIIKALDSGVSEREITAMITNQWKLWGGDPQMRQHFNPITLFRPANFEKYLGQVPKRKPVSVSDGIRLAAALQEPISDEQFNRNREASKQLRAALKGARA